MAVLGLVFGLLGFIASSVTAVIVLGWRNSTHKVEYIDPGPTIEQPDIPQHLIDQLPSQPEPETLEQYYRRMANQQDAELDF